LADAIFAISLFPCSQDGVYGDVSIAPMEFEIFHKPLLLEVVGLENGIFPAVELQRRDVMSPAELAIESGRGFHPFALQIEFCERVINKSI
jgi:hypothetical protein